PDSTTGLLDAMADVIRQLDAQVGTPGITSVGVGIAGLIDRTGRLRATPNLPGRRKIDIGVELDKRLGLPIRVDNDATCAAWAEYLAGAARGADDAVLGTRGPGTGPGLLRDARGAPRARAQPRPHRGRPPRAALPLRARGLLGALRIGQRPRLARPPGCGG